MLVGTNWSLFHSTVQEDKGSTSGLKRTLSDSSEKVSVERKGKKPKLQREELEAQLELKITADSAVHPKLEKVCMPLYVSAQSPD